MVWRQFVVWWGPTCTLNFWEGNGLLYLVADSLWYHLGFCIWPAAWPSSKDDFNTAGWVAAALFVFSDFYSQAMSGKRNLKCKTDGRPENKEESLTVWNVPCGFRCRQTRKTNWAGMWGWMDSFAKRCGAFYLVSIHGINQRSLKVVGLIRCLMASTYLW